ARARQACTVHPQWSGPGKNSGCRGAPGVNGAALPRRRAGGRRCVLAAVKPCAPAYIRAFPRHGRASLGARPMSAGKRLFLIIAPVVLAAAVLLAAWLGLGAYTRHDVKERVPDLRALHLPEAVQALEAAGLRAEVIDSVY